MPRKTFVAGEILTAADVNTNLMDQAVMSFAGTAARGSAIPSPTEGMVTYLQDSNIVSIYDGSNWKTSLGVTGGILQVIQTFKNDTFSTTSTSLVDVTGFSATITPKATSSKIYVLASFVYGNSGSSARTRFQLLRDSTLIAEPAAGGTDGFTRNLFTSSSTAFASASLDFLDSPNTTSAITYKLQMSVSANTGYLGRGPSDFRSVSTFTLMEVAD